MFSSDELLENDTEQNETIMSISVWTLTALGKAEGNLLVDLHV